MAGAELEIKFTGDDPEQREAFDRPSTDAAGMPTSPPADNASLKPTTTDPELSGTTSETVGDNELINSISMLVDKLGELIDTEKQVRDRKPQEPTEPDRQTGFLERILGAVNATVEKTLSGLGLENTQAGRAVGGFTRSLLERSEKASAVVKGLPELTAGAGAAGAAEAGGGAGAAGGLAAALGPVGIAAAATAVAFVGASYTVAKLSDAVQGLATDLEDLSPAIAASRAQFEAQRTLARLDRAERIGPDLAQLETARFRIQESMYEIQTKILELLLKWSPILEFILDGVNVGIRGIDGVVAALAAVQAALTLDPRDDVAAMQALANATTAFQDAVKELFTDGSNERWDKDPWLEELLKMQGPDAGVGKPPMGNLH